MSERLRVVKVGGSLYDLPDLGPRLRCWLGSDAPVLLVPGGGAAADVVRQLHRLHQLGDEAAHWLAIQALSLNARFLTHLLRGRPAASQILDALPYFEEDERHTDRLPHSWAVTSDSLALRTAIREGAAELVLLKSVAWTGDDWPAARAAGVVDDFFPDLARRAPQLRIRIVNLRAPEHDPG